jgi:hypothetical protein
MSEVVTAEKVKAFGIIVAAIIGVAGGWLGKSAAGSPSPDGDIADLQTVNNGLRVEIEKLKAKVGGPEKDLPAAEVPDESPKIAGVTPISLSYHNDAMTADACGSTLRTAFKNADYDVDSVPGPTAYMRWEKTIAFFECVNNSENRLDKIHGYIVSTDNKYLTNGKSHQLAAIARSAF